MIKDTMIKDLKSLLNIFLTFFLTGIFPVISSAQDSSKESLPNIIFILADDLGYGDLSCFGATKVNTPNIDRLANKGMRFMNAYSPSSVCTPTRYSLMTGRYAWRTWVGHKGVWSDDPLLIDTMRLTLPKVLRSAGYKTAMIGKWHLGFGAPGMPGWDPTNGPDYNKALKPGPLEVGFDYFFGVPHVGQLPHIYIENHRVVGLNPNDPLQIILDERWKRQTSFLQRMGPPPSHKFKGEATLYAHENLAVTLTEKAVKWIERQSEEPFFLYFAHRNVHSPLAPNSQFKESSEIGVYGDFINELDWSVGEILDVLDRRGLNENTLVFFSSDNGAVKDYQPSKIIDYKGHKPNGPFFGQKTEVYEGGVHVPLIARWPAVVAAGSQSDSLVALTDLLATSAELAGVSLQWHAGEDSFSFLYALRESQGDWPVRPAVILDSRQGLYAVREGAWKLIPGQGGGGIRWSAQDHDPSKPNGQLYNLKEDPGETTNLYEEHPDIVRRLWLRLQEMQYNGRSR